MIEYRQPDSLKNFQKREPERCMRQPEIRLVGVSVAHLSGRIESGFIFVTVPALVADKPENLRQVLLWVLRTSDLYGHQDAVRILTTCLASSLI